MPFCRWSLDAKNPPKKCLTFETLVRQRGVWPVTGHQFVRVPPYEILVFPTNFIFFFKETRYVTLRGKKCTALFHTHNWEKSKFLNALVRVFAQIYTNTLQGGTMCPTLGLIGLTSMMYPWSQKMVLNRSRKSWP